MLRRAARWLTGRVVHSSLTLTLPWQGCSIPCQLVVVPQSPSASRRMLECCPPHPHLSARFSSLLLHAEGQDYPGGETTSLFVLSHVKIPHQSTLYKDRRVEWSQAKACHVLSCQFLVSMCISSLVLLSVHDSKYFQRQGKEIFFLKSICIV